MDDALHAALDALLAEHCTPAAVRGIESGGDAGALWSVVEDSGFCDALRPEADGGAGLDWCAVVPLLELCGFHALPLPLGQTLAARAVLVQAGIEVPPGAIVLACGAESAPIELVEGAHAHWVLRRHADALVLHPLAGTRREPLPEASLDVRLAALPAPRARSGGAPDLAALQAAVLAAQMAGAMRRLLAMSVQHATQRRQFGRAIGAFQAIQQQLAVMAEQVEYAGMAARMAAAPGATLPDALRAALARAATGDAAAPVAAIAHAVHGAIGMTAEFDLQLWTRRLQAWRIAGGSPAHWHARVGRALLDSGHTRAPDFVLSHLVPP